MGIDVEIDTDTDTGIDTDADTGLDADADIDTDAGIDADADIHKHIITSESVHNQQTRYSTCLIYEFYTMSKNLKKICSSTTILNML